MSKQLGQEELPVRRGKRCWAGRLAGFLLFALLSAVIAQPAVLAGSACYLHHYLGEVPDEEALAWSHESQGVTHDMDNWYITQNVPFDIFSCKGMIWRIPITHNLADDVSCGDGGVSCAGMSDEICAYEYDHAGDPAYYAHDGHGYVFVPLEEGTLGPAVAVYRADASLALLGWTPLGTAEPAQTALAWCAFDQEGFLYAGNHEVTVLNRYSVDWDRLTYGDGAVVVDFLGHVQLRDENGQPLSLESWEQGGAFADDERLPFPLLYLINGNMDDPCDCGIHVFEMRESLTGDECEPGADPCLVARRVDRSTNGGVYFSYEYHPGYDQYEEPEGLTFWDLDADGRAPGIGGQLHAIMLDNELLCDDVYIKHYRLETDDVPPVITCPPDATVECTGNNGIEADDPQLEDFFSAPSATDECDDDPVITNDAPSFFPLGDNEVSFTAEDYFHNTSSCPAWVTVQDTIQPEITVVLDKYVLWPPNHRLVDITATVTVSDICDPSPTFVLTSISSNEPDNGLGDGDTANDIQGHVLGAPDTTFQLRAERAGLGSGRVYTIVYTASDGSGNTTPATVTVTVPHDASGSAKGGAGFNEFGTDFLPGAKWFELVVLSTLEFDATLVDPGTAEVGNDAGVVRAKKSRASDVDGDGRADVILRYSVAAVQRIREACGGDPLAFHYGTYDEAYYVVPDIFGLGSPLDTGP